MNQGQHNVAIRAECVETQEEEKKDEEAKEEEKKDEEAKEL